MEVLGSAARVPIGFSVPAYGAARSASVAYEFLRRAPMKTRSPISDAFSIKGFAQAYGVSQSTARREIALNRLRSQLIDGRHHIDSLEAERWLAAHGNMA